MTAEGLTEAEAAEVRSYWQTGICPHPSYNNLCRSCEREQMVARRETSR